MSAIYRKQNGKQNRSRWDGSLRAISITMSLLILIYTVCKIIYTRMTTLALFIPRHTIVVMYYDFTLIVRPSVRPPIRPSVFRFQMITWVNINGFSPNLVCALLLWRSGLGLLLGKFCQFLTQLSARDAPIFSFPDGNLSKRQWIFTKLGMCIDIVDIWFGFANGQISSIFDGVICPRQAQIFVSGL